MTIFRKQVPPLKANRSSMPCSERSWSRKVSTTSFSAIMMSRRPDSTAYRCTFGCESILGSPFDSSALAESNAGLQILAGLIDEKTPRVIVTDGVFGFPLRSEEHTSELQSLRHLVCRLLL